MRIKHYSYLILLVITVSNLFSIEKQWVNPEDIPGSEISNLNIISCAMDAQGNVVAVWDRGVNGNWQVQASRYDVATKTWTAIQNVSGEEGDQCNPHVAINSLTGDAVVVWNGSAFFLDDHIKASVYTAATNAWSTPAKISNPSYRAPSPSRVAMISDGTAIAVWGYTANGLGASRYANNQWTEVSPGGTAQVINARVAMNPAGIATVDWQESTTVRAARYQSAGGWTAYKDLSSGTLPVSRANDVSMDNTGNALAIWVQDNTVKAQKYIQGSGWEALSTSLSLTTVQPTLPLVAMASVSGDAVAVWRTVDQGAASSYNRIQGSHYNAQSDSWVTPAQVPYLSNVTDDSEEPGIAIDSQGNGIATWYRVFRGSQMIIQSVFYSKEDSSWLSAEDVSSQDDSAWAPTVAMNGEFGPIVMWGFPSDAIQYNYAQNVPEWERRTIVLGPGSEFSSSMDGEGNVLVIARSASALRKNVKASIGEDLIEYFYNALTGQVTRRIVAEDVDQGTSLLNKGGKEIIGITVGASALNKKTKSNGGNRAAILIDDGQEIQVSDPNDDVSFTNVGAALQKYQRASFTGSPYSVLYTVGASALRHTHLAEDILKSPAESSLKLSFYVGTALATKASTLTIRTIVDEEELGDSDYESGYQGVAVVWQLTSPTGIKATYVTNDTYDVGLTQTLSAVAADSPRVIASGGGFFMFAWIEEDAGFSRVKTAYYQSQTDAGVAQPWNTYDFGPTFSFVSPEGADVVSYSMDLDDTGNAVVVCDIAGEQLQSRFDADKREWTLPTFFTKFRTKNRTKAIYKGFSIEQRVFSAIYAGRWGVRVLGASARTKFNGDQTLRADITSPRGTTTEFEIETLGEPTKIQTCADFGGKSFGIIYSSRSAISKKRGAQFKTNGDEDIVLEIIRAPLPPQPPENAYGIREAHRFPLHIDLVNIIQWQSGDPFTTRFELYADSNRQQLLTSVDASSLLKFCHHCRRAGVQDIYYLYAVNDSGYSDPVIITVP